MQSTCLICGQSYPYTEGIFCDETTPYYQIKNCDLDTKALVALATQYDSHYPLYKADQDDEKGFNLRKWLYWVHPLLVFYQTQLTGQGFHDLDDLATLDRAACEKMGIPEDLIEKLVQAARVREYRLQTIYLPKSERVEQEQEEINKEALCSELATKLRPDINPDSIRHFVCSGKNTEKCINYYVSTYITKKHGNYTDWNGIVPCCSTDDCPSFYDTATLQTHLDRPTRKLLQKAFDDFSVARGKKQAERMLEQKQEQKEEHLTQAIYEEFTALLTPTCPNCNAPFIDWIGCYSVTCGICAKDFCGVCLTFFGTSNETHTHIKSNCKKHNDWMPVNPVCNYYGSPPNTPIMYIKIHTNRARWVNQRRAMYPTDPYLMAPTILEKVGLFYKTLSKTVQYELLTRLFEEIKRDIQQGTDKPELNRIRDVYGREILLREEFDTLVPARTKFYITLFDKEITCLFSKAMHMGNTSFFPINLFSFMDPVFFYDISQQRTFTTLFSFTTPFYTKRLTDATHREPFNIISMLYENFNFYSNVTMTKETYTSTFCDLLRTNRAVIAGGFVTNAVCPDSFEEKKRNSDNKDIDMYVHLRNAKSLVMGLVDLGYYSKDIIYTPSYDESFMRKNHILYRIHMVYERQYGARLEDKCPPIDVMIIPDEFELRSIVTNFDLTFCQVWYDGVTVQSDHWNDIDTKRGSLRSEYHAAYQQGNLFLRKRISKYQERGFVIQCPDIPQRVADILRQIDRYISFYKNLVRIIKKLLDGEEDVDQPYITTEEHRELIRSTITVHEHIVANPLFQQSPKMEQIETSCDTMLQDVGNSFGVVSAVPGRRLNIFWVEREQKLDLLIYYNTNFCLKPLYKELQHRKTISPEVEEQWIVTKMYQWMTTEFYGSKRLTFVVEHPLYPCTVKRLREIVSSYPLLEKRERTMINILHRTFQKETYPVDPITHCMRPVMKYFNDTLPSPYKEVVNKYKDNFASENGEEEGRKIRSNRRKNRKNKNKNRNSLLKKGHLLKKGRTSTHHRKSMKKSMKK